jgi:hypothetical protein
MLNHPITPCIGVSDNIPSFFRRKPKRLFLVVVYFTALTGHQDIKCPVLGFSDEELTGEDMEGKGTI